MHQIFPYYFITSQHILLLADNLTSAILISDADIIAQYRQEFEYVISISKPLFYRAKNINDAFDFQLNTSLPSDVRCYTLHLQPCFAKLFTKNFF